MNLERLEARRLLTSPDSPDTAVVMYHGDPLQAGAYTNEMVLTPENVASPDFGKLYSIPVNGQVYAQPLYVPSLTMPDGSRHDVVIVATQTDKVYAIDADNPKAGPNHDGILWMRNYTDPSSGLVSVPSTDLTVTSIAPNIGITGTPVIDSATQTMYFITFLKQRTGPASAKYGIYTMELHAVDLASGTERPQSPALIGRTTIDSSGNQTYDTPLTVPGIGSGSNNGVVPFTSTTMFQRPGLVLDPNVPGHDGPVIFAAFGSNRDAEPYHGWLAGWDATTLATYSVFNTTPNGYGGSFWQSGVAPVVLPDGNLLITTGNGAFDAQATSPPGPAALGFSDYGLGYGGIDHSAAVTFATVIPRPSISSTGLFFNGAQPTPAPRPQDGTFVDISSSGVGLNLAARDASGPHTMRVTLNYDDTTGTLSETIEDTTTHTVFTHDYPNVDLPAQVGGDTAYIGFGGSTDARYATNDVTAWTFNSGGESVINAADGFQSLDNFTVNGEAHFASSTSAPGTVVQLTNPAIDSAGTMFYNTPVNIHQFSTTFTFQMINAGTTVGDGLSFIIHNSQGQHPFANDYGDTMLQLAPTPGASTVVDYFTPEDHQGLAVEDLDFGTAGTLVIPPPSGSSGPYTAVELAKNGIVYVVDVGAMGHVSEPLQAFAVNPSGSGSSALWGAMAFFNDTLYIHASNDVIKAFRFDPLTRRFDPEPITQGNPPTPSFPGDSVTVSADGTSNGIVWDVKTSTFFSHDPAVLRAYDAGNLQNELYSSANSPLDTAGGAIKFIVPLVASGKVFLGTDGQLDVYGLKSLSGSTKHPQLAGPDPRVGSSDYPQAPGATANAWSASSNVEIRYLQYMIDLQEATVEIASLALGRSLHASFAEFAGDIEAAQSAQRSQMQSALQQWYGITYVPQVVEPIWQQELAKLSGLSGADFEKAFLSFMVPHLETGIMTSSVAQAYVRRAEVTASAQAITAMASSEIVQMRTMLAGLYGITALGSEPVHVQLQMAAVNYVATGALGTGIKLSGGHVALTGLDPHVGLSDYPQAPGAAPNAWSASSNMEIRDLEYLIDLHEATIEIAALSQGRSAHASFAQFASAVGVEASSQVTQMEIWLQQWYGITYVPQVSEPIWQQELTNLSRLSGVNFEKAFLLFMTPHLENAIMTSSVAVAYARHTPLIALGDATTLSQSSEIAQMRTMLGNWYGITALGPEPAHVKLQLASVNYVATGTKGAVSAGDSAGAAPAAGSASAVVTQAFDSAIEAISSALRTGGSSTGGTGGLVETIDRTFARLSATIDPVLDSLAGTTQAATLAKNRVAQSRSLIEDVARQLLSLTGGWRERVQQQQVEALWAAWLLRLVEQDTLDAISELNTFD